MASKEGDNKARSPMCWLSDQRRGSWSNPSDDGSRRGGRLGRPQPEPVKAPPAIAFLALIIEFSTCTCNLYLLHSNKR